VVSEPFDPRDLRVSDDERAHVIALLQRATGQGMIDLTEFNERSARAVAARTRSDLNVLLLDLPGLQIAGRGVSAAHTAATTRPAPGPGFSGAAAHLPPIPGADVLELVGPGARTLRGGWTVPSLIVIGGFGASTRLDFSQARLTSRRVTVEFRSNWGGSTEIVVPAGTTVALQGLSMRGGHLQNRIRTDDDGALELVLTGVKRGGHLSIRYPKQGLFGPR
jgi:hypothetical protein